MSPSRFLETLAFVLFLVAPPGLAQIELRSVDGKVVSGQFDSVDEAGRVHVVDAQGADLAVPMDRVLWMRRAAPDPEDDRPPITRVLCELQGGDRLYGEFGECDLDAVTLQNEAIGNVRLSMDRIRQVVVLRNRSDAPRRFGEGVPADRDVVFVRSNQGVDHVIGEVRQFTRNAVLFDWNETESTFEFGKDRVLAVRLAPVEGAATVEGLHAVVDCRDGSRLTGKLRRRSGGTLEVVLADGQVLAIPDPAIAEISIRGGAARFLSDVDPESVIETPYIEGGLTFGLHRDEGLRGGPVRIADRWFSKALAVHSRTVLRYALDGSDRRFSSAFGIDAAVADLPAKGSVAFSVRLDGKTVFGPVVARAGEAPRWIDGIELRGKRQLELVADFADNFHFNGWAIWGAPAVVVPDP